MNDGTTTFTGTIGATAVTGFGVDESFTSAPLTLAPGDHMSFSVDNESSNVGGFNGPFGSVQPGVEILLNGMMNGVEAVNLSVNDADIHSGVPRTNPFGVVVDSYVLQGGDPLGRDTGDAFETTQAPGHFRFLEAAGATVPEPSSLALFGLGGSGLIGFLRRSRRA